MEIVYTDHFWDRFHRRQKESPVPLTIELIKSTIESPDFILSDPKHSSREWRIKKISGRCLRVVVERKEDRLLVITLLFDRSLRRKGLCK